MTRTMRREVVMDYIFYADIFWLQNSLMNGIILLIAEGIRKVPYRKCAVRVFLVSGIGSLAEIGLLLWIRNYRLFLWISYLAVLPVLVFLTFGRTRPKEFFQNSLLCCGIALLLGGTVPAAENLTGFRRLSLLVGLLFCLFAGAFFRFVYRIVCEQKRLFAVELKNGGYRVRCEGLMDSGNLLREPEKHLPVHIVSPDVMERLHVGENSRMGAVLFHSLGKSDGILELYRIDGISVIGPKTEKQSQPAVIAKAQEGLLRNRRYQMILNEGIMEDR